MAPKNDFPLSLTIKAIDKATAPLREINAKIAKATAPVRKLNNSLRALSKESGITGLKHGISHVGLALGEVGRGALEVGKRFLEMQVVGGFALYEIVKGAVEAGAELAHAAKRTGLAVDEYAALEFAAGQAGVSQEEFTSSLDQFNKRLGDIKAGTGPLLEFLNKVRPELAQTLKHSKNTGEALEKMMEAFSRLKDPAKIAALQQAAFGRSSREMGNFVGQGSKKIGEAVALHKKLAGSQKLFAERSEESEKALKQMGAAFDGLRAAAFTGLLPAFTELTHALTGFLSSHRESIKKWAEKTGAAIQKWVDGGGFEKLIKSFKETAEKVSGVVDTLGGLQTVAIAAGLVIAGPLLSAIGSLALAVANLLPLFLRMTVVLGAPLVGTLGNFVVGVRAGYGAIEAFGLALTGTLGAAAPYLLAIGAIAAAGYEIRENWLPIKELFADIWHNLEQITLAVMGFEHSKLRNLFGEYNAGPAFKGLPETSKRGYVPPTLGASIDTTNAAPQMSRTVNDASVRVEFANPPKGTRVYQSNSNPFVDILMGQNSGGAL